jgi:hypothetical protein
MIKSIKLIYLEKFCISEAVSVLITIPIAMTPTCMTSKSTTNKIIMKWKSHGKNEQLFLSRIPNHDFPSSSKSHHV